MSGEEFRKRVEALFEAGLELEEAERERLLGEAGAREPAVAREARALLEAHERGGGILETDVRRAAGVDEAGSAPERIGPYRVERELGRGGMGMVYLAERADGQFRRRVALKILRDGPDAVELRRRFLAERQILASLDHQGIAKLLDGGTSADGRPFLVMEYVEGMPITEYCDRRRLSLDQRLRLFQEVCDAVHYAHQNLVLHRDLKPTNILVTEAGSVKLLDFGIAKLLNPTLGPVPSPVTRTEHRVMTPEYASPEQVLGEPLTTSSDVYSLGVLLYEILSGYRPYLLDSRSPKEVLEVVCERDPERPSTRVGRRETVREADGTEQTVDPREVSTSRRLSVERLQRRLRGDLDAIVLKALRKEAAHRYGSADLLSQDIERYLHGLPVTAHRGSQWYRFRKLVRRHRVQAVAVALVVLSLLGGAGVALWQAERARSDRERALRALGEAEAAREFVEGLFEATDPQAVLGREITADELLARGEARAEELARTPLVQARVLTVMGRLRASLSEYGRARAVLERALAIQESRLPEEDPEIASTLYELAGVLQRQSEYARAEGLARRALEIRVEAFGEAHDAVAESLHQVASLAVYLGELDAAESLTRRALAARIEALDPDDPRLGDSHMEMAAILRRTRKYDEAEEHFRRAYQVYVGVYGRTHNRVADVLARQADLLHENRRELEAAEALYREALEIRRAALGELHPRVAWGIGDLAWILLQKGDVEEARDLYREALAIQVEVLGEDHVWVTDMMRSVATAEHRAGNDGEALRLFDEVIRRERRLRGSRHSVLATSLAAYGIVRLERGDYAEADELFTEALEIRRRVLGPETPLVGLTMAQLAACRAQQGRLEEAGSLFRRSLELIERHFEPSHPDLVQVYDWVAEFYEISGRPEDALRYRRLADGG